MDGADFEVDGADFEVEEADFDVDGADFEVEEADFDVEDADFEVEAADFEVEGVCDKSKFKIICKLGIFIIIFKSHINQFDEPFPHESFITLAGFGVVIPTIFSVVFFRP